MRPRITLLTLAVADLRRSLAFYRDGLGLPTPGIVGEEFEDGAVVFFDLAGGLKLALYPRESLARDAGLPCDPSPGLSFSIAHNVATPEEVDAVMQQALEAGARIVKPAQKTFWGGYAGYFHDLDTHLWEIAWNPAWNPAE